MKRLLPLLLALVLAISAIVPAYATGKLWYVRDKKKNH